MTDFNQIKKKVLIFGGSGFIGSELCAQLVKQNHSITIICQNTQKAKRNLPLVLNLQIKTIDIFDNKQLKQLIKNYDVIINLIGKLYETQSGQFKKYHHLFAQNLAKNIDSNWQKLIHISALAIEKSAKSSLYASTKLAGENAIKQNCTNFHIIKPSIVYGENDNFFNQFEKISRYCFLPLIGGGKTIFSPVYIKDLVTAIIYLINHQEKQTIFEAYGPEQSSFKKIMQFILKTTNRKRLLIYLPFNLAKIGAKITNKFSIYLLTEDQVELLKYDNTSSGKYPNIDQLTAPLKSYQAIVPIYLNK